MMKITELSETLPLLPQHLPYVGLPENSGPLYPADAPAIVSRASMKLGELLGGITIDECPTPGDICTDRTLPLLDRAEGAVMATIIRKVLPYLPK